MSPQPSPTEDDLDIAEIPGTLFPAANIERCYDRYRTARTFLTGGDVLEVACGAGQGLGYLARSARRIVGADRLVRNLRLARSHYGDRFELVQLDAQALPFDAGSFDGVVLLEAVYMLRAPQRFVAEATRVLRPRGRLVVQTRNPLWRDFRPYRLAHHFPDSVELGALLRAADIETEVWLAYPTDRSARARVLAVARGWFGRLGMLQAEGRTKNFIRRVLYGSLVPFPRELVADDIETTPALRPVAADERDTDHLYIYAVGRRR